MKGTEGMKQPIEFRGDDGTTLRGWIRMPDGATNPPVVVLVNGAGFPKEWGFPPLAEVFADAGIASIAYDHRGFGESDGEPRYEVSDQTMSWLWYFAVANWLIVGATLYLTPILT